jgi:PAS domain S-box-containing protein
VIGQELRIQRFDGTHAIILNSAVPIRDAKGQIVGRVVAILDITERKRAEAALLRSEQRISTILTSITDCCYTLDQEWRFTTVNDPAVDYFHKTREELLGQVFWVVFPQTVGSFIEQNYRKAVQEQSPVHYETLSPISGLWVEVHAYPSAEGLFVILRDVTARKALEENLQESEQRYRDLIRYAPVGIYEIDFHKQRFTSVNDVMCQLTGYTRPELLEMNPGEILDDQGKKSFQERIQAWLAGEKPANTVEYRVKAKDGHTIYADLSVTFTSDENGKPIGATVIGYDLTERKRAEQALHEAVQAAAQSQMDAEASEARERARVVELETLMDVVPAMVWVSHDRDCREMTGNHYGSNFLKMWVTANLSKTAPDSALQQQPYRNFKDGREIPPEELPMQLAARTGLATQDYEFDLVFKDGTTRTVLGNVQPLLDEAGEPTGAIGAFMDITERKLAEEMLGTSEKRLWALLEHSPDGIVVVGIDGTVTFVSPSTTRILGYTPDDLLGKLPFDLIHPEEQEEAIALFTQFAGSPDQVNHAFQRLRHKDGSWRICEFTISNLLDEPGINGIVANYRDVTDGKLAEQALGEALLATAQSEEREKARRAELEAVMDAVPAIIWTTHDPQAQEMTGNRTTLDLMRMQPSDNLSKSGPEAEKLRHFKTLHGSQEIPPEQLPIQVAASTGKPVRNYEFDMVFADGEIHHLLGNAEPLTNGQGNPSGAVGAFIDITERKQNEERIQQLVQELAQRNAELEAERLRWKALVEGIADEVWACDTQGRMTLMSHPEVTLIDFKEFEKKSYLEILDEVDILTPDGQLRPEGQAPLIRSLKGEVFRGEEIMRHRRTGQTRYRHYSSAPIRDADGTILGAVAVIRDITELKQAENTANLRSSQVEMQHRLMDQREQERQQIARDLHDGPMQEILGAIYTLKGKMLDISDKDLTNDLQQVVETLHLQLAEMRSYASELRPPSLAKFGLEKAIVSYLSEWQDKHPDIQTQFKSDQTKQPLPEVVGLPLFRIFQQALANIIHHSQASQVHVHLEKKSGRVVRLTIQDNGVGFALPKDWLSLARAGHLGLVGMRERAEAIGGDLEIQSEPGQGTQIRVTVPWP